MSNGEVVILDVKDTELLRQLYSQILKQVGGVFSTVLHRKVSLTLSEVGILSLSEVASRYAYPQAILKFGLSNDIQGQGVIGLGQSLSLILCDILMGKDTSHPTSQLGPAELNILSQIMAQFANSLSVSLSKILNKKINIANLELKVSNLANEINTLPSFSASQQAVLFTCKFNLENLNEELFIQALPVSVAREFVNIFKARASKVGQRIEPLNLVALDKSGRSAAAEGLGNILVDIPLQLSVVLGRTKMNIREILELGVGSIIELDRLAGEPVDINLNNKPVAKGEVVVIDDNLGVRITSIIEQSERI